MSDRPRVPATEAGRALLNAWYPEDLSLADGEKGGMVEDIIAIEAEAALPSVEALREALHQAVHPRMIRDFGRTGPGCSVCEPWVDPFLAALGQPVPEHE